MENRLSDFTHSELLRYRALDAARWLAGAGDDAVGNPTQKFLDRFPGSPFRDQVARWYAKTAQGSAPTAWGAALMSPPMLMGAILDLSRPLSLLDRLVTAGARKVPINTAVPAVITGLNNFRWVGYGKPKPLSRGALARVTVPPATVAGLVAATVELFRAVPGASDALVDLLTVGAADFVNAQLVDPANAGTTDPFSPASVTNGVTPAGSSTGDPQADLTTLLQAYVADGGVVSTAVILISSANAAALAPPADAGRDVPTLTTTGGVLKGCPCLASDAVGDQLVMLDVKRLLVADPNEVDVDIARHTSLEMDDDPTQDSGTGVGAAHVSMWQTNSRAIRVERRVSWAYNGPIAVIDDVNYLSEPV